MLHLWRYIKYGLCVSHNTTSFYSLFIQADYMFRPIFLGHFQVARNVCLEEVIQVSHEIKYVELKFNEISLSFKIKENEISLSFNLNYFKLIILN
jgi:hypothetical protein